MTTDPPLKTQQRYAFLTLAIIAQVILLCILIPATRSEALLFVWLLLGTSLNFVVGLAIYLGVALGRSPLVGGLLYFVIAFVITVIEMLLLRVFHAKAELRQIYMGLMFPGIFGVANGVVQQNKPKHQQAEPNQSEKLRNRNGV